KGSGRLLSAWGKSGFAGAALLSPELGTGFSVIGALPSSFLPHDLRQSLGGAVVTGAGVVSVVTGLGVIVVVAGFVSSKRFTGVAEAPTRLLVCGKETGDGMLVPFAK